VKKSGKVWKSLEKSRKVLNDNVSDLLEFSGLIQTSPDFSRLLQTMNMNDDDKIRAEYEAIRHGVAVIDLSSAGKLQLSGKNTVQFLNGLVSNDVKSLQTGDGVLAAFPNLQGKLVALSRIYNTGAYLLIELDAINRDKIFKNLSRFVPAGEFFVTDVSHHYSLFSLQGPRSTELIEALTEHPISNTVEYKISERQIAQSNVFIAVHNRCGETGFDLFIPADASPRVLEAILSRGKAFGALPVGHEAFEIARIEAGVPREGVDAGEDYIILESELNDAVSYTKGCYLGQEVIARIHWRGQPAKRLRGLLVDADEMPQPGTLLYTGDGKKAGEITSSTRSIALDRLISLAYVHRYYLNPGTEFVLKEGEAEVGRAQLVELPFKRG
jgi:folate-binding protein YgfZ